MLTDEIRDKYTVTVGIECHVQLSTKTKLFSGADNDATSKRPNGVVSPIDFALPGMLPVLNRQAVNLAIMAAVALNAPIAHVSRFDRKHYFYPDLPKGYQTTQMYNPIILAGHVDVPMKASNLRVRIHHAHLEEDAGKLTHAGDHSLVDLNRAGTPLIEIVSEPDMHSAAEAKAYAVELYRLMTYAGVTKGNLFEGNMRFDVNISVALNGESELGERTEIKNLNSFRSIEKAIEYESWRQMKLLEKDQPVTRQTRGWDEAKQKTTAQRSKEDAQDYRYMPDADIPPIVLSDEEISEIQALVPPLPSYYRQAWEGLDLDDSVINSLLSSSQIAGLITVIQNKSGDDAARRVAHWFSGASSHSEDDVETPQIKDLSPEKFIELSDMVAKSELSSTSAKDVFVELLLGDGSPREIAESRNLLQVSDEGFIESIVDEVLSDPASTQSIEDIKNGKAKAIGYLVGQVMKKSRGKANPSMAQEFIRKKL